VLSNVRANETGTAGNKNLHSKYVISLHAYNIVFRTIMQGKTADTATEK